MKKALLITLFSLWYVGTIAVCIVSYEPIPKKFTLTEEQAGKLFQAIEVSKKGLPSSTSVSALEASTALQSFQEVQKVISYQYKQQTDTVKPKK